MSKRKIQHVITQYADATRRAIKAGFDGVEISSAQRLLIQTFLSTFSNQRDDEYGAQTVESRSRFGIEVFQAVQKVIDEEAPADFLYFIDQVIEVAEIQYIATASWGKNFYKQTVRQGRFKGEFMNQVIYDHIAGRIPVMATGGINSPEKSLEALGFADMIGASTPFVTEPDFVTKLKDGREDDINLGFSQEEIVNLAIPERTFKDIVELMDMGGSI